MNPFVPGPTIGMTRNVALFAAGGVLVTNSTSTYCEFVFTSVTVIAQLFGTLVVMVSKTRAGATLAIRLVGRVAAKRQRLLSAF